MVQLLTELAALESPTDDPTRRRARAGSAGSGVRGERHGRAPCTGTTNRRVLLARPAARLRRRPLQLLVGHCDTVWPVGTEQADAGARRGDDQVRGPGVFDMKGGLVQMIFALRAVRDRRPAAARHDRVVVINSDEETGSPDSTPLIRPARPSRGPGLHPRTGLRRERAG